MKKRVHSNSRDAYAAGSLHFFPKRARAIIAELERQRRPLTDRAIMLALGFHDPNAVRPRITELVELGVLREAAAAVDAETVRNVRTVELAVREAQMNLL